MKNVYPCKKVSHRKDILCGRYKKDKKMLRTKSFWNAGDLSFLHRPQKMSFHLDFFCTNIECSYVHLNLYLIFFNNLKFIFWVVGVDAPMSRSGFPIQYFSFFYIIGKGVLGFKKNREM